MVSDILTIIGPDNGSSPIQYEAMIRSNAGLLPIGHSGTHQNAILFEMHIHIQDN